MTREQPSEARAAAKGRLASVVSHTAWVQPGLVALLVMTGALLYVLRLGQDVNYDLRNYHYYDGWAILHGRSLVDLWPARLQSFLNPITSIPDYLLIAHLPPVVATSLLTIVQALNGLLVWLIARSVFAGAHVTSQKHLNVMSACALLIGVTAPLFLSELGTTFPDATVSLLVLTALLVVIRQLNGAHILPLAAAGLLFGVAVGIRLPSAVFAVGFVVAPLIAAGPRRRRAVCTVAFGACALFGFLAAYGWWALMLTQHYGAPFFPFYNAVFNSPYYAHSDLTDARFLPASVVEALSYPFQWAAGLHPSSEESFRDIRFAFLVIASAIAGVLVVFKRWSPTERIGRGGVFIVLFFWTSFAVWLNLFGISRYIIVLELLTGVAAIALLLLIVSSRARVVVVVVASAMMVLTTVPANWGHVPWSASWFGVDVPPALLKSNELFVITDNSPISYVVPFLPADAHVVRITGQWIPSGSGGRLLRALAAQAITSHDGPIFTLSTGDQAPDPGLLNGFALRLSSDPCVDVGTRVGAIHSCRVDHV